jgi:hypothetical protein
MEIWLIGFGVGLTCAVLGRFLLKLLASAGDW